jgi:hypothetical protein
LVPERGGCPGWRKLSNHDEQCIKGAYQAAQGAVGGNSSSCSERRIEKDRIGAAQPQAGADGSPSLRHERPQLKRSVRQNNKLIESLEGLIARTDVVFDKEITSDGNGSLRITTNQPTTIRLYETGDIDVENARLTYQAKVRTEGIQGKVYLEMWCQFIGKGEFFSRGLSSPLSGTTDWSTVETPFFLKKGENPDNVKLNLVIEGKGTVWIDDVHLFKGPLQ